MLVFALMLIAGGLVVAVSLIIFLAENLFALFCAALAARAALAGGGGWPGAIVASALTFAVVAAALRLSLHLTRSPTLRMLLASLVILPGVFCSFLLTEALLWPFVPASTWRTCLSLVAAAAGLAGMCRRLWPCDGPHYQTKP